MSLPIQAGGKTQGGKRMPNFSDYDRKTGQLLDPEYWEGEPDPRSPEKFISDYFDPDAKKTLFWKFDPYRDWLIYPPRFETGSDAEKVITEWISREIEKFEDFRGGNYGDVARKYMNKFGIGEHIESLTCRFVKENHRKGWTPFKERNQILQELGRFKVTKDDKEKRYIVEFKVTQTYQFTARTKMDIDSLFDYYIDEKTGLEKPELLDKVKNGNATPNGDLKLVDESLDISQLNDNLTKRDWRRF